MSQDVLLMDTCRISHKLHERPLGIMAAKQGDHIHLGIVLVSVVDLTVKMDCQVGNHQQVTVHLHKL